MEVYRGFSDDLDYYYVDDIHYSIKEVKGLKPKELAKTYSELAAIDETVSTLADQIKYNDQWDLWAKDVLETYLEFDYNKEVNNYDLLVLRKMGAEIFSFLMIAGTSRKEYSLSSKQLTEIQKKSSKTKN